MRKACKNRKLLMVKKFEKNFTDTHQESEQYVALQNNNIGFLSGWNEENVSDEAWEVIVKITNSQNGRSIYRRAIGYTTKGFTAKHIMLSYRSMKYLGVEENADVKVQSTNWFLYLWNHAQSSTRYPFRIAIIFGIISILLGVLPLLN